MAHNSTTRSLVLDRTVNDGTVQPFLSTLKRNSTLLHLSLAHCGLSPDTISRVVALVRANSTLLWVDLTGNSVHEATLAELESILAPRRAKQTPVPLVWSTLIPPPVPLHGAKLHFTFIKQLTCLTRQRTALGCAFSHLTAAGCAV